VAVNVVADDVVVLQEVLWTHRLLVHGDAAILDRLSLQ
jgi:hypothetical protein